MTTISTNTLEYILDTQYNKLKKSVHKRNINLLFEGDPSSGKSFLIERWANKNGLPFISLSAPTLVVETLTGIPYREKKKVFYSEPYWMEILCNGGVLLIDEFNAVEDDVQKILLSLLSERRINSHVIHDDVLIVAAQNDYRQVNNYKVSPALLSRFSKYTVSFDYNDWRTNHLPTILSETALDFLDTIVKKGFTFSKGQDFVEKEICTTARSVERWLTGVEEIKEDVLMFTAQADIDDSNLIILQAHFKEIHNKKDEANSFFGGDKNINPVLNQKLKKNGKVAFDSIKRFTF